ncbi:MAG: acyl-CoA desaturase [Myxococcales bacterium]|nr:acyl-CoA desaturase [Myxococcales bacterium]MCB9523935.1 acyl-CoA desaturase [Myxococcales bacterium]
MKDDRIKFDRNTPFQRALRDEVDAYFKANNLDPKGGAALARKAAFIIGWFLVSYAFSISGVLGTAGLFIGAVITGLAHAAIGFDIMHDGNHGAFSTSKAVNRWMGRTLDMVGGSSYLWRHKHNVMHHTYPNVVGTDDDIDVGGLARLAPEQPHYAAHRLQHLYMWGLYGLISVKWNFYDDFAQVAKGQIFTSKVPRPKGEEMVWFVIGKIIHFGWALVLPIALFGWGLGIAFYLVEAVVLGVTLAVVFQLAHCVEEADFTELPEGTVTELDFAKHQLATTVDFARDNKLVTWFLGGLNFQAIHHLFPKISHVHYPALSPIVERVCAEHGVAYRLNGGFMEALGSHYRWLKRMSIPPVAVPVVKPAL